MDDEKFWKTIIIVLICILGGLIFAAIACMIDFKNDYKCSINRDPEYWKEHNCVRYCKECEDID